MRTRAQRKPVEEDQNIQVKVEKTKKEIMNEKRKAKKDDQVEIQKGKKKVKKDEEVKIEKKEAKPKKGKQARVTQQPKKEEKETKKDDKQEDQKQEAKKPRKKAEKNQPEEAKKQQQKPAKQDSKVVKDKQVKEQVKKVIMKGKVPVDDYFSRSKNDYHVLQHDGKVYSATLNQTNVSHNNNKFYLLQILQHDKNSQTCFFFARWGRVGVPGQTSQFGPWSIQTAIGQYNRKYHEKHNKGDYHEVELNYEEDEAAKDQEDKKLPKKYQSAQELDKQKAFNRSSLPLSVKRLIELIFDLNMMNKQMKQIGYNVTKMPLGKLSGSTIKQGFQILQQLQEQLKGNRNTTTIEILTNHFYSLIPHDFGFSRMSNHVLNDLAKVVKKVEMLESLRDIKIATRLLKTNEDDESKLDTNYKKLNRTISPIDRDSEQFKILDKYLQTTHAQTHGSYKLQVQDIFSLQSQLEQARFTNHIHNKQLLWHGSRLTNFVGILSQGLRIAPPQAPVTGYMFGKGVYFADMSSKSANYCFANRDNNTGILLLCEVALGDCNEKFYADFNASLLPPGKHSTKGVGKTAPQVQNQVKLPDGVIVPMGPGVRQTLATAALQYNEFIVYDIAQIKVRYLLRTKFIYR